MTHCQPLVTSYMAIRQPTTVHAQSLSRTAAKAALPLGFSNSTGRHGQIGAVSSSNSNYFGNAVQSGRQTRVNESSVTRRAGLQVNMRLKGEHSFKVKGDLHKVFEYASDFSRIDEWDPGTPRSQKDSSLTRSVKAPVGVGTQFNLRTILLGYITPTVYEVMEYEPPRKIKLYGVSRFHDSWDTLSYERDREDPGTVRVDYTSYIQLTGWFRFFQFLMRWMLLDVFQEAVDGLEAKLTAMEPELQPTAGARR